LRGTGKSRATFETRTWVEHFGFFIGFRLSFPGPSAYRSFLVKNEKTMGI